MICKYCKTEITNLEEHIWEHHKDLKINDVLISLDSYIINRSKVFIKKYSLHLEMSDVAQYVRTGLFLILRDKFDFNLGTPEKFCKASIKNFLLQVLQDYKTKKNSVHNDIIKKVRYSHPLMPTKALESTPLISSERSSNKTERWSSRYIFEPIDNTSPDSVIEEKTTRQAIEDLLSVREYKVFVLMADVDNSMTQQEIADELNISQPMVNRYIKSIRRKVTEFLDNKL